MTSPLHAHYLVSDDFKPAYLALAGTGAFEARLRVALGMLEDCHVCPRACGGNRLAEASGTCHTGRLATVANAFPHFGEEECLRGTHGSGTIFFSQCNLHCVFCQNWDISHRPEGHARGPRELASLMLMLQEEGCHNINLVTPSHVVPQIVEALAVAVPSGLRLPLVYNTSAYDSMASLQLLDGVVDVYMPDFKFWLPATARRLAAAEDYPECAREAIREMHRQVGVLKVGRDGVARRGVLVRHLVMPGQTEEAAAIFAWIAQALSPDTVVNVMAQYRPECRVGLPDPDGTMRFTEIDRRPTSAEVHAAREAARAAGLWRFA